MRVSRREAHEGKNRAHPPDALEVGDVFVSALNETCVKVYGCKDLGWFERLKSSIQKTTIKQVPDTTGKKNFFSTYIRGKL